MTARLAIIVLALACAACATGGDVSLLQAPIPMGSTITPPERSLPAVQRFPVKVAANSWTLANAMAGMGYSAEQAAERERAVQDTLGRVRGYFETDGLFPTAQIVITPGRPQVTSGAEAQLVGGISVSKSVQSWSYTFNVEDWENAARPALSLSGRVEVVGTLKISFGEIQRRVQEWSLATSRRGIQNVFADLVENLERNRAQLADLRGRYIAWRGQLAPADATSRRDRIRRVEELLAEAARLNPGGSELGALRRRLDALKRAP